MRCACGHAKAFHEHYRSTGSSGECAICPCGGYLSALVPYGIAGMLAALVIILTIVTMLQTGGVTG